MESPVVTIRKIKSSIWDGLENLVSGMGTALDKGAHSTFVNNKQLSLIGGKAELTAMYRTDWVSGKIVDIVPDDMTREWREFDGSIEPEQVQQLVDLEGKTKLVKNFNLAHKWARLYGYSLIVLNIDDGLDPEKPLDISRLRPNCIKHIQVVDRHRISTGQFVPTENPLSSNYGMPEFYLFHGTTIKIHHSRVLRFDGNEVPFIQFRQNNYSSDSVLDRLYEALLDFKTVTKATSSMIHETNLDVIKIKGLMNYLSNDLAEKNLKKRLRLVNQLKSNNNMLVLDKDEEYDKKTNTFSGLPEIILKFAEILSAGSDVPATRLLGSSASGLNATGEGDLKNYYDKIRSDQVIEYKPRLDYFDSIMAKHLAFKDDAELNYSFRPLFQMTPTEIADINIKEAQKDDIYLNQQVVTPEIVAKELKQKGTYTNIEDEYIDDLSDYGGFDENEEGIPKEEDDNAKE